MKAKSYICRRKAAALFRRVTKLVKLHPPKDKIY